MLKEKLAHLAFYFIKFGELGNRMFCVDIFRLSCELNLTPFYVF